MNQKIIQQLTIRLGSVFVASAIPNIAVGSVVGVEVWKSSVMAGTIAVLAVVQKLATGLKDGTLSEADISEAFEEA